VALWRRKQTSARWLNIRDVKKDFLVCRTPSKPGGIAGVGQTLICPPAIYPTDRLTVFDY
jgi:hypothetical protein